MQANKLSIRQKLEGHATKELYQREGNENVVEGTLVEIVRKGARRMLASALEEEVNRLLGSEHYERGEESVDAYGLVGTVGSGIGHLGGSAVVQVQEERERVELRRAPSED